MDPSFPWFSPVFYQGHGSPVFYPPPRTQSSSTSRVSETIDVSVSEETAQTTKEFMCVVKIINPKKKSKFIVRTWHEALGMAFLTPDNIKECLQNSFLEQVPSGLDFGVGYFHGTSKQWLCNGKDGELMYINISAASKITLWCDGVFEKFTHLAEGEAQPAAKKRKITSTSQPSLKYSNEATETIFQELKGKHPSMETPKLRLWAKMIEKGRHGDYDKPPNIPLMNDGATNSKKDMSSLSPLKHTQIRRSCLEDLQRLKALYDQAVLLPIEYHEEKDKVLKMLKTLK
uniref:Uncharacterized protein n=1 Tax=Amphimedon queenslandica TaxID=400682 RepID=A0A1X7UJM0_AMPQE